MADPNRISELVQKCVNNRHTKLYRSEFGGDLDLEHEVFSRVIQMGFDYLIWGEKGEQYIEVYDRI